MGQAQIITIKVLAGNEEYRFKTYANSHKNLMALLHDEMGTEELGECKGMGRCGTCQVKILDQNSLLGDYEGNERNTLKMLDVIDPTVRLSCKIFINELINNIHIAII